jgi:hypothetical protein
MPRKLRLDDFAPHRRAEPRLAPSPRHTIELLPCRASSAGQWSFLPAELIDCSLNRAVPRFAAPARRKEEEPPEASIRDWARFLLFCGVGTYVCVRALGWAGLIAFYGSLILFGLVLWLPGFVHWWRARPLLVKMVSQLPPGNRRRFLAGLPPRDRRKWERRLAKRRLARWHARVPLF